jgi:hypothetical protein
MQTLILTFSTISFLVSLPALVVALYTLVEIKAMKKSTHKVEYMPVPVPEFTPKQDKEFKETLNEDHLSSFIV